ncbi:uncharacterized protein LOC119452948 [Dermacentor silvarum]|uniref:uncharacterized protein LOC119452948 n=1 Tax=Dermacentor silvarum TaxID=543639 RepID=UPI001899CE32|nr:uncharacterized protein LOC119452948 [Dermacentor silvarum]
MDAMDAVTAVVCVTASLATVWCVSEAYLRYVFSKRVVEGTLPSNVRHSVQTSSYGTLIDACQEMTPSYRDDQATSAGESLNAVLIIEDSKPPPYDQCLMQESEPPPYVESLAGE